MSGMLLKSRVAPPPTGIASGHAEARRDICGSVQGAFEHSKILSMATPLDPNHPSVTHGGPPKRIIVCCDGTWMDSLGVKGYAMAAQDILPTQVVYLN